MLNYKLITLKMQMFYRIFFATLICVQTLLLSCSNDNRPTPNQTGLELVNSLNISVSEPSGLAISYNKDALYTVSDNNSKIYKLSFLGSILKTFDFVGDDLEGVSQFGQNKLLLAEERDKTIIEFDINTEQFIAHEIDYDNNEANSGLEGVAYKASTNSVFILNEKDPGLLMKLNANFIIESTYELDFASDYSGIFYDDILDVLWIVSDQSKTLNKCKLNGILIKEYPIEVTKAEGVVVTNNKIYIVSDSTNKLYTFNKPEN